MKTLLALLMVFSLRAFGCGGNESSTDDGADDDTGDDTGDDSGDDTGDDSGDDTGDDSGDDLPADDPPADGGSSDSGSPPTAGSTVVEPNGGELVLSGESLSVEWTSSGSVSTVDLLLLYEDTVVATIAEDQAPSGSLMWPVTLMQNSGHFLVRAIPNTGTADVSDDEFSIGSFITFRDNSGTREVLRFDPWTGVVHALGAVTGYVSWNGNTAIDRTTETIYIEEASAPRKIHRINMWTGAYIGSANTTTTMNYMTANHSGGLFTASWNGSLEELFLLNATAGGSASLVSTVGNLATWGTMICDPDYDYLWIGAAASGSVPHLYQMNATTGALVATLDNTGNTNMMGLQRRADGLFVYARWDGSYERVMTYNPVMQVSAMLGTVGDGSTGYLTSWTGITALDPVNSRFFVFGNTGGGTKKVWIINAATGAVISATDLTSTPTIDTLEFVY